MYMEYLISIFPQLLNGMEVTFRLFGLTIIGSVPIGIILAFVLCSRSKIFKSIIQVYVWLMRGTPLLLQLIFVFYGLPIMGIVFDRFEAALVAFILNYAAYFAEIFRGGIQSIPNGQYEAARVLRLTYGQTLRKIIIPQVFKVTLPSVGNEIINLVKDTSLVYILGLQDVMRIGKVAMERDVSLVPLLGVGILYLLMVAVFTLILRGLEKRMNYYR
ncbi:putative amino acid ABC transporter permease protein [Tetragenococcus halophilus subsp. halophilus]|uniref:Amino acid ABC transporter permease protein n=2 Tax=Tetragenococcus halophilus TaxID=51669 RepID=A0AAN1SI72_TETHN|nr:putative amino acid ABC transporter permease protein [Tetragenococcus halophilus NBRC 12172]GBD58178.1 putative amino acid ABC transporter permease protein [Tetragenococcus halophilus subsp. halophilus]GBD61526.1 putative amino acid ABC transporter permease protein [Tetragenococcus halophilus subsp. halophilus]GBD79822.1 putative amino acid ABC transporter permease protein [Tetragenococcus halophilus subsp. halophilus]GBD82400.1 putative amino acid ABC transporter permease protein [Tetrageno